jgi:hypothetical protein
MALRLDVAPRLCLHASSLSTFHSLRRRPHHSLVIHRIRPIFQLRSTSSYRSTRTPHNHASCLGGSTHARKACICPPQFLVFCGLIPSSSLLLYSSRVCWLSHSHSCERSSRIRSTHLVLSVQDSSIIFISCAFNPSYSALIFCASRSPQCPF